MDSYSLDHEQIRYLVFHLNLAKPALPGNALAIEALAEALTQLEYGKRVELELDDIPFPSPLDPQ